MPANGGFWRRVVAYIIDAIILQVALSIVGGVLGVGIGMQMLAIDGTGQASLGAGYWIFVALSFVGQWLYFALLEASSWQGTLGKKALGMSVTDLDGNRIGFGRATGRYFAKIISGIILLIGFIMVAFTRHKQGLHDILAGTLVYKASPSELAGTNAAVFA